MFDRIFTKQIDERIGDVFLLVIVIDNPGKIGSRQIESQQPANDQSRPTRARSGKKTAEAKGKNGCRQRKVKKIQPHFVKTEAHDLRIGRRWESNGGQVLL